MTIRITWRRAVAAIVLIVAAGMLYSWSGLFNVAASSGHWKATDWFLHWVMRNSVRTHAFSTPDDVRDDGAMVSAANHYAQACASCHGAPGIRPLPVMHAATPPAPDLSENARAWSDAQLFWILEHGVKYSGMPAWAAKNRQDEIRRMVGFVRRLPVMSPEAYRALTATAAVPQIAGVRTATAVACVACHGSDGRGRGQADIPVLGGQKPEYLAASLAAYASGRRNSAVMAQAAATLSPAEIAALSAYFAGQPGLTPDGTLPAMRGGTGDSGDPPDLTERGTQRSDKAHDADRLYRAGRPDLELPACTSCHDPAGRKAYPVITGQRAAYIAGRLRGWRGEEGVIEARLPRHPMPTIARRIPEDMIDPLARYLERAGKR